MIAAYGFDPTMLALCRPDAAAGKVPATWLPTFVGPARGEYLKPEKPQATRPKGKVLEYLRRRGLFDDTLAAYKVAANHADDEIIFPYLRDGELVNCKYLKLDRPQGKKLMRQ